MTFAETNQFKAIEEAIARQLAFGVPANRKEDRKNSYRYASADNPPSADQLTADQLREYRQLARDGKLEYLQLLTAIFAPPSK